MMKDVYEVHGIKIILTVFLDFWRVFETLDRILLLHELNKICFAEIVLTALKII